MANNYSPRKRAESPRYRWKQPPAFQSLRVPADAPMPVDYRTHLPKTLTREQIAALYPGVPISRHKR